MPFVILNMLAYEDAFDPDNTPSFGTDWHFVAMLLFCNSEALLVLASEKIVLDCMIMDSASCLDFSVLVFLIILLVCCPLVFSLFVSDFYVFLCL